MSHGQFLLPKCSELIPRKKLQYLHKKFKIHAISSTNPFLKLNI